MFMKYVFVLYLYLLGLMLDGLVFCFLYHNHVFRLSFHVCIYFSSVVHVLRCSLKRAKVLCLIFFSHIVKWCYSTSTRSWVSYGLIFMRATLSILQLVLDWMLNKITKLKGSPSSCLASCEMDHPFSFYQQLLSLLFSVVLY